MIEKVKLNRPWMVAVWPGMGGVALNAGIYLLSKLDMQVLAEFEANELFDIDHVDVKAGIIQAGKRPRNRFYLWRDPKENHDLIIFLGEAQPPLGRYSFCRQLINYASKLKVERVITFAAMATQMHPAASSRIFAAATEQQGLEELKQLELETLEDGQIGGLNGVLLGAAAEMGLRGACLLGEIPHIFHQLPFPKASLAILEVFATIAHLELDFSELADQARNMENQLGDFFDKVQEVMGQRADEEEKYPRELVEEAKLSQEQEHRIEELFKRAMLDRSKAFELKRELDRLGTFKEYEDRFLDLFKKTS
jgi:proteasome assembly chaperone (PAC2) family protein